jgi:hypothetical protein
VRLGRGTKILNNKLLKFAVITFFLIQIILDKIKILTPMLSGALLSTIGIFLKLRSPANEGSHKH